MQNTADLITSLKKVFSNTELKVVTECLKKIKEARDGVRNISSVLNQLKLVIFRDQKNPRVTDAKFNEKHECILKLQGFIPPMHKAEFAAYFEPIIGPPATPDTI